MLILERRNNAGRVVFRALEEPWAGTQEDAFTLLDFLDQLRMDASFLSSQAVLADLTDELAPVSPLAFPGGGGVRREGGGSRRAADSRATHRPRGSAATSASEEENPENWAK